MSHTKTDTIRQSKTTKLAILIATFWLLCACEQFLFQSDQASNDPLTNFDYLWNQVDRKYSYFELKGVDWEAVREEYRPRIHAGMGDEALFNVMAEMLNLLRDDHSNLISPFNVSIYNVALQNPDNLYFRTIQLHYLRDIQYTGGLVHSFLRGNRIGYIRYGSFMNPIYEDELDHVLRRYRNTAGLILDLRANGGGYVDIVPQLLSRFVTERTLAGWFRTRNGPGHDDFGEEQGFYITPNLGVSYRKPVVVLIDRGSYSATTMFALATKALPDMILLGDTTGGGGGAPNGGQLPNGWIYRFSVSQLLDLDGNIYAEDGVPPYIEAQFDWNDLETDEILERAIRELLN